MNSGNWVMVNTVEIDAQFSRSTEEGGLGYLALEVQVKLCIDLGREYAEEVICSYAKVPLVTVTDSGWLFKNLSLLLPGHPALLVVRRPYDRILANKT